MQPLLFYWLRVTRPYSIVSWEPLTSPSYCVLTNGQVPMSMVVIISPLRASRSLAKMLRFMYLLFNIHNNCQWHPWLQCFQRYAFNWTNDICKNICACSNDLDSNTHHHIVNRHVVACKRVPPPPSSICVKCSFNPMYQMQSERLSEPCAFVISNMQTIACKLEREQSIFSHKWLQPFKFGHLKYTKTNIYKFGFHVLIFKYQQCSKVWQNMSSYSSPTPIDVGNQWPILLSQVAYSDSHWPNWN